MTLPEDDTAAVDSEVFGRVVVSWETRIGPDWAEQPLARNVFAGPDAEPQPGESAFYELPWVYPVTVVQARYSGFYEGGEWLAFPCHPARLRELCPDWDASDVECVEFWHRAAQDPLRWLVGRGSSASAAYDDLVAQVRTAP